MSDYLTLNSQVYYCLDDKPRGEDVYHEKRGRAVDATLLVDRIRETVKETVTIVRKGGSTGTLTLAESAALRTLLKSAVTVGGDIGTFTARPRDVSWGDVAVAGTSSRFVTVTLEEV